MGATEMQSVLMILGGTDQIEHPTHRETILKLLMEGFCAGARLAGASVGGGQTILNRSPIIGGVASAVLSTRDLVGNDGIRVNDYLVLTKPLGTDAAVRSYQNRGTFTDLSQEEMDSIENSYALAVRSMAHFNRAAGGLLRKYGSTGATDVTGYGILGHAENLASVQRNPVSLRLFLLPCIDTTAHVFSNGKKSANTKLHNGRAVETSGGLLAAFPSLDAAKGYLEELQETDGTRGWFVGRAVERQSDESAFLETIPEDRMFVIAYGKNRIRHAVSEAREVKILHVRESDFFVEPRGNPCDYDQDSLAKRLT
mmetsp:Transcript_27/g.57  ORF Transcript_27/g.57 Transcript_27/m.57 type:complete len:312 (-) Transcript_27:148-1083(-)